MKWPLPAIALVAPIAAPAQTAPVPLAPETWPESADWLCDWHRCDAEGSVRFALAVTPQGRVKTCEIIESSGHARLDEATCRFLVRRARFTPARDKSGNQIDGRWESRVHWKVPSARPEAGGTAN